MANNLNPASSPAEMIQTVMEVSGPDFMSYSFEEVPGDTRTPVYFVTAEYEGESYELVIKFEPESDATFAVGPVLHDFLAERTDIPVPAILTFEPDPDEDVPAYFITERVRGENLDELFHTLSLEQREHIMEQIGCILGDLHSTIAFEGYGRLDVEDDHLVVRDISGDWRAYFEQKMEGHIDMLAETTFEDLQEDARARITDRLGTVPQQGVPRIVHDDFRPGNVLVEPGDKPEITAVIDWEQTLAGDPLYNVAEAEFLFIDSVVKEDSSAEKLRERLYEGYSEQRSFDPDDAYEACKPLYQLSTLIWRMAGFDSMYDEISPLARTRAEAYYRDQFASLARMIESE